MGKLLSCEFNMDTVCVELKFADGSMLSIDCIAVENEFVKNMYQREHPKVCVNLLCGVE